MIVINVIGINHLSFYTHTLFNYPGFIQHIDIQWIFICIEYWISVVKYNNRPFYNFTNYAHDLDLFTSH
jgi:hypothetical protein